MRESKSGSQPFFTSRKLYGGSFRVEVQNRDYIGSPMTLFLEHCGSCSERRMGVNVQDYRECSGNWDREGSIQIEFREKRLPTNAYISLWPKYTGSDSSAPEWGNSIEIVAVAKPINQGQGFQIVMRDKEGVSGSIIIKSDNSNHLNQPELDITVSEVSDHLPSSFGPTTSTVFISQRLQSFNKKTITSPSKCQRY